MRGWRRWEDWTVVVIGLIMALTPLWSEAMGNSVSMLITAGALLFVVGMINLAGPNLYGIEIGQLLAGVIAIILPGLGGFAGFNISSMTAWIGGGLAVVATLFAMKPSVESSHRLQHNNG